MLYQLDDEIFSGWDSSISNWSNPLPDLNTISFFQSDPAALESLFGEGGVNDMLARQTVFSAVRNCMSQIAVSYGYFQTVTSTVRQVFQGSIDLVSDIMGAAFNAFSVAINSIAWVPVVGWILKIIEMLAQAIVRIVAKIKAARKATREFHMSEIAAQESLPLAESNPDADQAMCRDLQARLSSSMMDVGWAFGPRYPATRVDDFVAMRQRYSATKDCTDAWLVMSELYDSIGGGGLGFVPGTTGTIHGNLSLITRQMKRVEGVERLQPVGERVQDNGGFFPITASVAASVWGQLANPEGLGGLTFAINPDELIEAWEDYVGNAYAYGYDGISGWSQVRGKLRVRGSVNLENKPLTMDDMSGLRFLCTDCEIVNNAGLGGCTYKEAGKGDHWIKPPGNGHQSIYIHKLYQTFKWEGRQYRSDPKGDRGVHDDDRWGTTTPVKALKNLKRIQEALVQSPRCMYLDDNVALGAGSGGRFKGIARGTPMHSLWNRSVRAMFESGDWKHINYLDVIKGEEVDVALGLALKSTGQTQDQFFNMNARFNRGRAALMSTAPPKLKAPTVPLPPKPEGVASALQAISSGGGGRTKKSSSAPLLLAAGAAAFFMMRGRK